MKKRNLLITGGAGFIGSNLVEHFVMDERIGYIRILDNLSNGKLENISRFLDYDNVEFMEGDIRSYEDCMKACCDMDLISHQAALGSVPRSISNPVESVDVNVSGTVNLLFAAVQNNVARVCLAFSSSTYGDSTNLPKVEDKIGNPLSPYAVTKLSIEHFAEVFNKVYGLNYIGLRYFNIFGPNQDPDNPYAAVIPLFIKAAMSGENIYINGPGDTSRDFTHVSNAVYMNDLGLFTNNDKAINQVYNVACGERLSLNDLVAIVKDSFNSHSNVIHREAREGDVKHSLADIEKSRTLLGYEPKTYVRDGLVSLIESYKNN